MKPLRSLWVKLLAGYLVVALAGVGLVALLANRATARQLEVYVSQGKQARAERLAPTLAGYFSETGNWTGVDAWLAGEGATLLQSAGRGMGPGRGQASMAAERVVVADAEGLVVADSGGSLVGKRLSDAEKALGTAIRSAGQQVGTLLLPAEVGAYASLESTFLRNVNRSLLWAGLGAAALALALGAVLARQLTAPLRSLTHAARRLAGQGSGPAHAEVVEQVEVRSRDEIGELGLAFNQMSAALAQQERLRRNLTADIAHELRTPLSVIRGDLEALLDGVYLPTPEALASLHEETLLLSRLVDDLRALALAEAGQLRLERRAADLGEVLSGVVEAFAQQAESQGQALRLDLPPGPLRTEVDSQRIRQVVANLVSNALRHAAVPGSQVVVSARQGPGEVEVAVADSGPGIPPAELGHVFDRFWRGEQGRAGGSGLGLAIARELVSAHGGQIWVESSPGHGTVFRFSLPD
ncbi:MAG TPA: ATP-binding protein [Anaerolineae bacterium]|nr:ATP-binding protein [Anaerolineae bacterium]